MPWQIAPALVIISAAFTLTGGAIYGIQYAAYGKVRNGISAMSVNSTSIFSFHSIGPPVLQSLTDRCFDVSLAPLQTVQIKNVRQDKFDYLMVRRDKMNAALGK
jgi:hypothetical protein